MEKRKCSRCGKIEERGLEKEGKFVCVRCHIKEAAEIVRKLYHDFYYDSPDESLP